MKTEPATIDDPGDQRVAAFVGLRDRDLRRGGESGQGQFIVEGSLAVRALLQSPWPLESLLLTPQRAAALSGVVDEALGRGVPVYVAGREVFDQIAGFPVHRGVMAAARRVPSADPSALIRDATVVVVVEGVNDHENLGAIFRNAAALGGDAVLLDPSCCDPLYRRSVRVSLGHVLRVPFSRLDPWPDSLADLRSAGFELMALDPHASQPIRSSPAGAKVAVMVGGEGHGLSEAAARFASRRVRIPMAGGVDSLNVATALAIALHVAVDLGGGP